MAAKNQHTIIHSGTPLVSAIIATYNRARFVGQAVTSILSQTYPNIETIVIDDGSTDQTREVLEPYFDRITYVHQQRCERSKARNRGFQLSNGDYIAFLDSDDLWHPSKIEQQVGVLNGNPQVGLVYGDVEFIDECGKPCANELQWEKPTRLALYEDLMTHNIVTGTTSCAMIRRTILNLAGLFDEAMNTCEDLDLYRRISMHCDFHKINAPLVLFRLHGGNTQGQSVAMAKGWEITIKKIMDECPSAYLYYRNEAIIKLLSQIFALYSASGRTRDFYAFCLRSVSARPNWILKAGFWQELIRLSVARRLRTS